MTWLVCQTKYGCEDQAHFSLVTAKFKCYLPRYMGKRGVRLLFPRYIFVGWSDEWRRLYSISGLKHPLMDVDKPAKVQDNVIEAFRSQQKDGIIRLPRREERFKRNTRLGVTRGPFENQIGLYLGMTDQDREIVLFNIIGRKVPVEFADPAVLYPIL